MGAGPSAIAVWLGFGTALLLLAVAVAVSEWRDARYRRHAHRLRRGGPLAPPPIRPLSAVEQWHVPTRTAPARTPRLAGAPTRRRWWRW